MKINWLEPQEIQDSFNTFLWYKQFFFSNNVNNILIILNDRIKLTIRLVKTNFPVINASHLICITNHLICFYIDG